ncbi:hypothetical protein AMATHDRAFT_75943 [Amanita thiersii Skay4041]|uniref:Spindle assembly checkpoint component MAD1 n=1 Tax=Amanita thiersii Skay4041 TaxID=703135 RepID=A0A2A9NQ34_9AGAR|nr:hypothetical protein AMATHDRAFT_75943 [Amanita thiersii Skay4041]
MSSSRAPKRDSLAAELERDPQLSSAKRQQRKQLFTSTIAHASLERQLVASQSSKLELEVKLREKSAMVERLERDRRFLADREKELQEERERERAEAEKEKNSLDATIRTLRTNLSTLQEEHDELSDTHTSLTHSTSGTISSLRTQLASLKADQTVLEATLTESRAIAAQHEEVIASLRSQLRTQSQEDSKSSINDQEAKDMAVVRDELHRQASYLRSLERENSKLTHEVTVLREHHSSLEVLREEKRGMERKLRTLDELRNKVGRLEAELEASRRERESSLSASTSSTSPPPVAVTQSLATLRLEHAALLESHGSTMALLRAREAEVAALRSQSEKTGRVVASLQDQVRALDQKVRRRETRLGTADREIGFLQALVASYTAEASRPAGGNTIEVSDTHIEAQSTRINQLETLLQQYKSANQVLSEEIDALGGDTGAVNADDHDALIKKTAWSKEKREALEKEAEQARKDKTELQESVYTFSILPLGYSLFHELLMVLAVAEIQSLEELSATQAKKIDDLEQELFELSGEIAGGRHVPPGVRVLSMRDNPEEQWFALRQEAMDLLRGENEALLRRLGELEDKAKQAGMESGDAQNQRPISGGEPAVGPDLVPKESFELVMKEKQELDDTVKQKEKRLLRLQQVFTSKSAEFREAIASILGVKLAFYPNGQVRITSMYDLGASFVFQPIKSGQGGTEGMQMQLVAQGEGGPQDLPNMMHYWIEKEQCIPGFMASVTLESWDKHKSENGGQ